MVKVKEKGSHEGIEYKNSINISDPSLLSLLFDDLERLFNAPIKKANKMLIDKGKVFPFSP